MRFRVLKNDPRRKVFWYGLIWLPRCGEWLFYFIFILSVHLSHSILVNSWIQHTTLESLCLLIFIYLFYRKVWHSVTKLKELNWWWWWWWFYALFGFWWWSELGSQSSCIKTKMNENEYEERKKSENSSQLKKSFY